MRYFSPVGAILLVISSIAAVVGVVIVLNYANVTNVGYGVIPFAETATEYAAATTPSPAPSPSPALQAGSCTYGMNGTNYTIAGSGVTAQTCADALAKISAGAPSPSPTATPSATPSPTPVPSASTPAFVCLYNLPDGSTVTVSNTSITDLASCIAYAVKQLTPSTAPVATPMPSMSTAPTPTPTASAPVTGLTPCPDAFDASMLIAGRNDALLREGVPPNGEECLFETNTWKPGDNAKCPDGWACEMDTVGPGGKYAYGGNKTYSIDHGSFRLIAAYPATDMIHNKCGELLNSQGFVDDTSAKSGWKVAPDNFVCEPEMTPGPPPATWTANSCPAADQVGLVAQTLGGTPAEWSTLSDGRWKRAMNSPRTKLAAPWGTLDVWDGVTAHMGVTSFDKSYEATWNCGS